MKKVCFVICPIGEEGSEERNHADRVLNEIINPIAGGLGYEVIRADKYLVPGQITPQIVELIVNADLLIADLSYRNPNVFYELALRHITRKPFIHLIREGEKIPFDIKDIRAIKFNLENEESIRQAQSDLEEQIRSVEQGKFGSIQYISTLLSDLEIIFHALKYFVSSGKSEDRYRRKFGRKAYKDEIITNLDFSESEGDELDLENVNANRVDASTRVSKMYQKSTPGKGISAAHTKALIRMIPIWLFSHNFLPFQDVLAIPSPHPHLSYFPHFIEIPWIVVWGLIYTDFSVFFRCGWGQKWLLV